MVDIKGKKITVLGSHGFIGSSLARKIADLGGIVTTTPTKDSIAILHFASYTHIPFEKNPAYHTQEILNSFMYLMNFCEENNITFIYPSSALVYEKPRPFFHLKKVLEEMQYIYKINSTAFRIFPVYGIGEGERGHPTAIKQWIQQMIKGVRPVVFGDGTQSRDFIYISDVVDTILEYIGVEGQGVRDIGAGKLTTFNEIIKIINKQLRTDLKPDYVKVPSDYAVGVQCPYPIQTKVSLNQGINYMIKEALLDEY